MYQLFLIAQDKWFFLLLTDFGEWILIHGHCMEYSEQCHKNTSAQTPAAFVCLISVVLYLFPHRFGTISKLFENFIQLTFWDLVCICLESDSSYIDTLCVHIVRWTNHPCVALQRARSTLKVSGGTGMLILNSEYFLHKSEVIARDRIAYYNFKYN